LLVSPEASGVSLLCGPKGFKTFCSGRWTIASNLDFSVVSINYCRPRIPDTLWTYFLSLRIVYRSKLLQVFSPATQQNLSRDGIPRKRNGNPLVFQEKHPEEGVKTLSLRDSKDINGPYEPFCNLILCPAKASISSVRRHRYSSYYNLTCQDILEQIYQAPEEARSKLATFLISHLDEKRRTHLIEAVQNIYFTHSSRNAWSLVTALQVEYRYRNQSLSLSMPLSADWCSGADTLILIAPTRFE